MSRISVLAAGRIRCGENRKRIIHKIKSMMTLLKQIISTHDAARIEENLASGQRSLHAVKAFKKGGVITPFYAERKLSSPTCLTIQKDDDLHITLSPSFLQYVNHSCLPNAFFDTDTMKFIALTDVEKGDELRFFYPSTEWEMAQPFRCHCGAANCLQTIQGAAYVPDEILMPYRLTDFILSKREQRKQSRA